MKASKGEGSATVKEQLPGKLLTDPQSGTADADWRISTLAGSPAPPLPWPFWSTQAPLCSLVPHLCNQISFLKTQPGPLSGTRVHFWLLMHSVSS